MGFIELSERLNALSEYKLADIVSEILERDIPILIEIQKDQLYAGQNAKGEKLSPSYSSDPYFKSPLSAKKYADFKSRLNQRSDSGIFTKRDNDTPNLIVTGTLIYNTIYANVNNKQLILSARSSLLSKLEAKYSEPFGLNQIAWDYYMKTYFIPDFKTEILTFLHQA